MNRKSPPSKFGDAASHHVLPLMSYSRLLATNKVNEQHLDRDASTSSSFLLFRLANGLSVEVSNRGGHPRHEALATGTKHDILT